MKTKKRKEDENSALRIAQLKEIEGRLKTERREIVEALYAESRPGNELVEGWQELDDPSEREIRDVEFSHQQSLRERLRNIDKAVERLSDASYGICAECGQQISLKRLSIDPAVTLCIDCQGAMEGEIFSPSL